MYTLIGVTPTCTRCGVQSGNRPHPGAFERASVWPCRHTLGRRVVSSLGGCVDELLHCSCWAAASEESILCRTGELGIKSELKLHRKIYNLTFFPLTHKTHSGVCLFDFLEMLGDLFFTAELSLTLRTLVVKVLQCVCLLAGCRFVRQGYGVQGGLP